MFSDAHSIDIGNLRFDVKQHASQTPISFQGETLDTRGKNCIDWLDIFYVDICAYYLFHIAILCTKEIIQSLNSV